MDFCGHGFPFLYFHSRSIARFFLRQERWGKHIELVDRVPGPEAYYRFVRSWTFSQQFSYVSDVKHPNTRSSAKDRHLLFFRFADCVESRFERPHPMAYRDPGLILPDDANHPGPGYWRRRARTRSKFRLLGRFDLSEGTYVVIL